MVKKLLHTRYRVTDLEKTVAFYKEVLGLKELRRHTSGRGSQLVFLKAPQSEEEIELCKFLLLIFRPMKLGRTWIVCFCVSALALTTFAQEQDAVRPTGIQESLAKESPQISPPRATRARSRHRHAKTKAPLNEERDEV